MYIAHVSCMEKERQEWKNRFAYISDQGDKLYIASVLPFSHVVLSGSLKDHTASFIDTKLPYIHTITG